MESLAGELLQGINQICGSYHYFRRADTVEQGIGLAGKIQQFISILLERNLFGLDEQEWADFQRNILDLLKDYAEAAQQKDAVLMVDTLDYGFREYLTIFANVGNGEG